MKKYKDLKISVKLIIGFLIVALLTAVVGVTGIFNISVLKISGDEVAHHGMELQATGDASIKLLKFRYYVLKHTMLTDRNELDENLVMINESLAAEIEALDTLKNVLEFDETELVNLVAEIDDDISQYQAGLEEYFTNLKDGNQVKADSIVFDQLAPLGNSIIDKYNDALDVASNYAAEISQSNAETAQTATIIMIIVMPIALLIALFLGLGISRSISKPIQTLSAVADMLADGDVNVDGIFSEKDQHIKQRKDEIGKFAVAFHRLIEGTKIQAEATRAIADGDLTTHVELRSDKDVLGRALSYLVETLNQLASSIINASEQVASGSGLVSNSSMALSQGATEQASAIQQLTASIEEIAAQTNKNADNAGKVDEISRSAKTNAAGGNERMKDMLTAMEDINISSGKISKIIKVIDDIAFQTNILALNAAVEAARAGQYGKGFAVVAEEVRTLAARSANAAKETTDLIENSISKVETGTKIANETAVSLEKIVTEVDKVAELVATIASASKEQASSIEQINVGVSQVSQVVQTNAATAEESAAASEELSAQAEQLKQSVEVFKINDKVISTNSFNKVESTPQIDNKLKNRLGSSSSSAISLDDSGFGKY